jgi:hypothetical protein
VPAARGGLGSRQRPPGRQHGCLADPGGAVEDERTALAVLRPLEERGDLFDLAVAL